MCSFPIIAGKPANLFFATIGRWCGNCGKLGIHESMDFPKNKEEKLAFPLLVVPLGPDASGEPRTHGFSS